MILIELLEKRENSLKELSNSLLTEQLLLILKLEKTPRDDFAKIAEIKKLISKNANQHLYVLDELEKVIFALEDARRTLNLCSVSKN